MKASTTKSRKARPVPLGAKLHELLELYIERYRDNTYAGKNTPVAYLFRRQHGQYSEPIG